MSSSTSKPELVPDENCWRVTSCDRGGFLLSGAGYFEAFRGAVLAAERQVVILAWDLNEGLELVRGDEEDDGYPTALAEFLVAVLEEKPELEIFILLWDYSVFYLGEREWLPFTRWRKPGNARLHFVTDDAIAAGASHHQKVVLIDGALAFCGGFDLCFWRWDTEEHLVEDERRQTAEGDECQPFHDVQVAVQGPVVGTLRELCALRWKRATGSDLPEAGPPEDAPWPAGLAVDFEDEEVGVALTFAKYEDHEARRDIEQLHLDVIAGARTLIYAENQYLSSHRIVKALAERLREPDGPEVVLVLTRDAGGWAEEGTMGVLRDRLLEILQEADEHGRFAAFFPQAANEEGDSRQVYVHAKILIADHRMLLVGSANLSNRSMKVDSEVELAFLRDEPADFIRRLHHRLLAIHCACDPETVATEVGKAGSLREAIMALRKPERNSLQPLEGGLNSALQRKLADTQLLDPDEPLSPAHHFRKALRRSDLVGEGEDGSSPMVRVLRIGSWVVGIGVAGYFISQTWSGVFEERDLRDLLAPLADSPYGIPLFLLIFVVATVLAAPMNLFVIATTVIFNAWIAVAVSMTGCLLSAAVSYGLGRHFGKPLAEKIVGDRVESLSSALANRGIWSIAALRLMPLAPYGVMNLAAGVSNLRFRVFMIGSAIGLLPGVLGVVLFTRQFLVAVTDPGWKTWLTLGLVVAALGGAAWWIRKRLT